MVPFRSSSRIAHAADAGYLLLGCLGASLLLHLLAMAVALHLPTEVRAPEPEPVPIEVVIDVPRLVLPPAPSAAKPARIEASPAQRVAGAAAGAAAKVAPRPASAVPLTAEPAELGQAAGEAEAAAVRMAPHAQASEPAPRIEPAAVPTTAASGQAATEAMTMDEIPPVQVAVEAPRQPAPPAEATADAADAGVATVPTAAKVVPLTAAPQATRSPPTPAGSAPGRTPAVAVSPPATASAPGPAVRASAAALAAMAAGQAGALQVSRSAPAAAGPAPARTPTTAVSMPATASAISQSVPANATALASAAVMRAIDPEQVREGIARRLLDLPCSRLDVAVNEDLTPVIRGRVESAEDLALVREAGSTLSGAEPVLAVEVVEPPFCNVLGQLEAMTTGARGPSIALNHPDATFATGEFVVVTIQMPRDFVQGYLHVMFVDAAGKVVHLLPNPYAQDTQVVVGQTIKLGVEANERRPGVRDYRVTPPYGHGMLLAILSSTPLAGVGESEVELVEDLIPALALAVARAPTGSVRVSRVGIVTHP